MLSWGGGTVEEIERETCANECEIVVCLFTVLGADLANTFLAKGAAVPVQCKCSVCVVSVECRCSVGVVSV